MESIMKIAFFIRRCRLALRVCCFHPQLAEVSYDAIRLQHLPNCDSLTGLLKRIGRVTSFGGSLVISELAASQN